MCTLYLLLTFLYSELSVLRYYSYSKLHDSFSAHSVEQTVLYSLTNILLALYLYCDFHHSSSIVLVLHSCSHISPATSIQDHQTILLSLRVFYSSLLDHPHSLYLILYFMYFMLLHILYFPNPDYLPNFVLSYSLAFLAPPTSLNS